MKTIQYRGLDAGRIGNFIFAAKSFDLLTTELLPATLKSWDEQYIGDAHHLFFESITRQCQTQLQYYARYQSIIQSSGMGKSRMIDELSKEHIVIPINLRTSGTGMLHLVLSSGKMLHHHVSQASRLATKKSRLSSFHHSSTYTMPTHVALHFLSACL